MTGESEIHLGIQPSLGTGSVLLLCHRMVMEPPRLQEPRKRVFYQEVSSEVPVVPIRQVWQRRSGDGTADACGLRQGEQHP